MAVYIILKAYKYGIAQNEIKGLKFKRISTTKPIILYFIATEEPVIITPNVDFMET